MHQRTLGLLLGVALSFGIAGTALGSSCANLSREPAPCGLSCTSGPVFAGNWVWLPSISVPVPAWGFLPPGTPDAVLYGTPDANGNYTDGYTWSLLGHSAYCLQNVNAAKSHGIVSGCVGP